MAAACALALCLALCLALLAAVPQASALQCYTCNTTYTHRFTDEVTWDLQCGNQYGPRGPENHPVGPVVTCTDPRQFCVFHNDDVSSHQSIRRPGCGIPVGNWNNRFFSFFCHTLPLQTLLAAATRKTS